jgi:hypothetical protein
MRAKNALPDYVTASCNSNAAIGRGTMNMENPLCQIQPSDGNCRHEYFLLNVM